MKSIQKACSLLLGLTLVMIMTITNVGGVFAPSYDSPSYILAEADTNTGNQVKGNVQKAQGKVQEIYGNVTGDRENQVQGKAKQAEGEIRLTQGGSESEIEGKARQAENNIYRYQSRDDKATNVKEAVD